MRLKFVCLVLPVVLSLAGSVAPAVAQSGWQVVAPGVWRRVVGRPESPTLIETSGAHPVVEALRRLPQVPFPLVPGEIEADIRDGRTALRFPLERDELLYGLGLDFQSVQKRGSIRNLHVDHYGGKDNGRTHAPVPFYVSSRGYGVLVDAVRYVTVYAGTAVRADSKHPPEVRDRNTDARWTAQPYSDAVEILVPAPGATVYVFAGPTPLDAVRRYNLFSGGGVLPPKWGLGFIHRVPKLFTAEQAIAEADAFEKRGYPLDVIGLEPGWQSMAYPCSFTWDSTRFTDPSGFLSEMTRRRVQVNLWLNPYVAPTSPIYKAIKPLSGSHTVWTGLVPDITLPATRKLIADQFGRDHLDIGVSGYKLDEIDGYDQWLWPDHARFPSGLSGEQMRQVYGLSFQRLLDDAFRARNRRTYGLIRASNAGAARFPFVIYNDYYSHRDFITALLNSGFIGVLWTPEARSSRTGEEWLRRMQTVCFSPMAMINAWADGTEPWTFPEVADAVRDVMQLRIRLLPYLYTTFAQYHFEGTPPFRAMPLVEGFLPVSTETRGRLDSSENPYEVARTREIKDQYMVGENLLVAPLFAGDSSRQVVLPPGKWYDFYTGQLVGEGSVITVRPGLNRIPVFVRDGGIVPMLESGLKTPAPGEKHDLVVRHYGVAEGTFRLYDDDGTSFDYERGAFSWTELVARRVGGTWQGHVVQPSSGKPFNYGEIRWEFMTGEP